MRLAFSSCAVLGLVRKAGLQTDAEVVAVRGGQPNPHPSDPARHDTAIGVRRLRMHGARPRAAAMPAAQPPDLSAASNRVVATNVRSEPAGIQAGQQSAISEIHLSYDENKKLRDLFASLNNTGHDHEPETMPSLAGMVEESLAASTLSSIRNFPKDERFAMIVRNLPSDPELPPTPDGDTAPSKGVSIITASILGVFGTMNLYPIGYQGEADRSFFRHVAPRKRFVDQASSYGANLALGMHMDSAHLPLQTEPVTRLSANPEYVSLTGVRMQVDVPTRIVQTRDVLERLPGSVRDALMKPDFSVKRPASFSGECYETDAPILVNGPDRRILCRYDQKNVFAKTNDAASALKMFDDVAHQPDLAHRVLLNKGDMLILKNQQTLHARDSFTPRFDGTDRWIIRVFGTDDLSRMIPVSPARRYIVRA